MAKRPRGPGSSRSSRQILLELEERARDCRRCDLWKLGTQTVFGSGSPRSRVMLIGEQPGDQEDLAGEPFVGPAGLLLREALSEAGFDLADIYLTNAVKHFKWKPRGKRRIHDKPNREQVLACRMWLDEEIAAVRPHAIVALGATAAAELIGPKVRVMKDRGRLFESPLAPIVTLTVHPSSILRASDPVSRRQARAQFIADLKGIRSRLVSS